MRYGINTIDDFDVSGKTVLVRIDINQPVDEKTNSLKDITRIRACVPTIKELSEKNARVVLMAHQGSDIEYENFITTEPHSIILSRLLGREVKFIDDVCGPAARDEIKKLENGEILLLDNVRFLSEEQTLFEQKVKLTHEQQAKTLLVRKIAPLADLYICDAFAAAHRNQPSLCGFEQVLPSAMGRLFEKEYSIISGIMEVPEHPCTFVLGGAKISDAFMMMDTVLRRGVADHVLTGGLVAEVLLWSIGVNIGETTKNYIRQHGFEEYVATAKEVFSKYHDKIILPSDCAFIQEDRRHEIDVSEIQNCVLLVDIGRKTVENYKRIIENSKIVFVNGPVGVFEKEESEFGTKEIWKSLEETSAYTVLGGGHSIEAVNKYIDKDKLDYICTGGGALIRFLTGEELPVIKALRKASAV